MLYKILGAVAVMAASIGTGYYFAGKDGYRLSELAQMKKALTVLLSEIRFCAALPEAAKNVSERTVGHVSLIFDAFAGFLNKRDGCDVQSAWESALGTDKRLSYFLAEDWDMLMALGKTFGYLDKEMQIDAISLVISQIIAETELLIKKREKNKKMYMNLGILGGLALVTILL